MEHDIPLIINADDFGYFACTSRGIADAAQLGRVTATGVLATRPDLARHLTWLEPCQDLDLGVHLNLTWGTPLTAGMSARLSRWNGHFPGLNQMTCLILAKSIEPSVICAELRSQIDRCLRFRGRVAFLNSHQHIHMLPTVFRLVIDLAREYRIPAMRIVRGTWRAAGTASALIRNVVFGVLSPLTPAPQGQFCPQLVGLNESGGLNGRRLERLLRSLKPGAIYELMCHPGYFDHSEIRERSLIAYHDWKGEYDALTSPALPQLLGELGISLTNYRALTANGSVAAPER